MNQPKSSPTSIWPGKALHDYLALLGPRERSEGVSKVIERLVARYTYIIRSSIPAWSIEDWLTVIQILQGHETSSVSGVQVLGLVIQSRIEHKREGSATAASTFAYQAKRLSEASLVAVAEIAEGYWRRHDHLDRDALTAWLHEMGAPGLVSETTPHDG